MENIKCFYNACLNVTDACNLGCKYCFVEQNPHYMTLETAKQCVDFLANNIKLQNKEQGHLTYFGGEPMLLWDEIIVPLTIYIKQKYNNLITLGITTNGTLLNSQRIKFMFDNQIIPHLSFDGPKEVQDINRPCKNGLSSFDLVVKNIPELLYYFPNTTMRATISQQTVQHTYSAYAFAVEQGFKNFFITPNCREQWDEENLKELNLQAQYIYTHMFGNFLNNVYPISFSSINKTFEYILNRDLQIAHNQYNNISVKRGVERCGLGTVTASFSYDGNIYGCQEQNSYGFNNIFHIGDIYNGIDTNRHKELLKLYCAEAKQTCVNKQICNNCPLRLVCQDLCCPSVNWDLYQDFFTHNEVECKWQQILFYNALFIMHSLVAQNNECFKQYLNIYCNYPSEKKEEV